ncbi:MAG TPA: hypothetical protein VGO80_03990 [Solirubrobacteraceae bacterium]|jgi:hypothetical protein|nr:hypothetical protein [Solirubrobacteraceae bacterium]
MEPLPAEVLRLNVEDVDIPGKRARACSKGGDVDRLFFGSGSAWLLARLKVSAGGELLTAGFRSVVPHGPSRALQFSAHDADKVTVIDGRETNTT